MSSGVERNQWSFSSDSEGLKSSYSKDKAGFFILANYKECKIILIKKPDSCFCIICMYIVYTYEYITSFCTGYKIITDNKLESLSPKDSGSQAHVVFQRIFVSPSTQTYFSFGNSETACPSFGRWPLVSTTDDLRSSRPVDPPVGLSSILTRDLTLQVPSFVPSSSPSICTESSHAHTSTACSSSSSSRQPLVSTTEGLRSSRPVDPPVGLGPILTSDLSLPGPSFAPSSSSDQSRSVARQPSSPDQLEQPPAHKSKLSRACSLPSFPNLKKQLEAVKSGIYKIKGNSQEPLKIREIKFLCELALFAIDNKEECRITQKCYIGLDLSTLGVCSKVPNSGNPDMFFQVSLKELNSMFKMQGGYDHTFGGIISRWELPKAISDFLDEYEKLQS